MTFAAPSGAQLHRLLRQEFDPKSIRRGNAYFRGGHVLKVEIERVEAAFMISGEVQGTARRPYLAVLELLYDDTGFALLNDYCNCPLGGGCKHAVALLLAVSERLGANAGAAARTLPPTQWDQWFKTVQAPAVATVAASTGQRLGFIFDDDRAVPLPTLTVRPIWLSRLKNGGWGRPEPLKLPGPFGAPLLKPALDDQQHALVAALRMQPTLYANNVDAYRLTGPRADGLLESLLEQHWCCWQKPRAGELTRGEPLPLHWQWQLQPDGSQHLRADGTDGLILLQAGGLWYFDAAQQRLGRVEHDAALAQRLLQMPALAPEHIEHVSTLWQRQPPLAALPSPLAMAPARTIGGSPAPVLILTIAKPDPGTPGSHTAWVRQQWAKIPTLHIARLQFDYAGQRVDAEWPIRPERRLVDDRLLLIERDARGEQDGIERLRKLGLQPAQDQSRLPWPMADCMTAGDWLLRDPKTWHDPLALPALGSALSEAGVRVEFADDYPIELLAEPDAWYGDLDESGGGDWFNVELGIQIGDERVSLLPILARALEDPRFPLHPAATESADAVWLAPLDDRRRVPLPLSRIRAMLAPLLEWMSPHALQHGAPLRVPRLAVDALADLQSPAGAGLTLGGASSVQAFAERLRQAGRDTGSSPGQALPFQAPEGLLATPRAYQLEGLRWLQFLADAGLGGVLADDMGLGKTLQVLMHLLVEKQRGRLPHPALVVCPTSVVGNWCEQAARFAPDLRVLVLHGSDRAAHFDRIGEHDLVVTTYALLPRDRESLLAQHFTVVVFDEAQAIKNPRSQAAQVARVIPAQRRLAVTGTPMENHLGELWAQMDCVLPGLLGDARHFSKHFRTPIEKHGDADRQTRLNRRIAPFMLRRDKESVAPELPAKTIIEHKIELAGRQRELYETLRLAMHGRVREALAKRGLAQSSIVVLDALLKLRQACCDPRLVKLDGKARTAGTSPPSAKLDVLLPMLDELVDEGRRILLFSQFTGMLDLIEAAVRERGIAYVRLDGSTRDRATPIWRFQAGEAPLFLISLKAGGVGLNLTAADTVIHYDPWWNPAVEAQATDRAHRIGQDKPVFVYKLICTGTVEEKIQVMQQRKANLAQALLGGGTRSTLQFDETDIEALFAPA
ncbi:MAG: DEAD/DEAH box helicase [Pseudomonadota bacterium]|nr:DEAD/DEAH box helicase [Pseudomonadota bacterium]